jgi:hypothetical protein
MGWLNLSSISAGRSKFLVQMIFTWGGGVGALWSSPIVNNLAVFDNLNFKYLLLEWNDLCRSACVGQDYTLSVILESRPEPTRLRWIIRQFLDFKILIS